MTTSGSGGYNDMGWPSTAVERWKLRAETAESELVVTRADVERLEGELAHERHAVEQLRQQRVAAEAENDRLREALAAVALAVRLASVPKLRSIDNYRIRIADIGKIVDGLLLVEHNEEQP